MLPHSLIPLSKSLSPSTLNRWHPVNILRPLHRRPIYLLGLSPPSLLRLNQADLPEEPLPLLRTLYTAISTNCILLQELLVLQCRQQGYLLLLLFLACLRYSFKGVVVLREAAMLERTYFIFYLLGRSIKESWRGFQRDRDLGGDCCQRCLYWLKWVLRMVLQRTNTTTINFVVFAPFIFVPLPNIWMYNGWLERLLTLRGMTLKHTMSNISWYIASSLGFKSLRMALMLVCVRECGSIIYLRSVPNWIKCRLLLLLLMLLLLLCIHFWDMVIYLHILRPGHNMTQILIALGPHFKCVLNNSRSLCHFLSCNLTNIFFGGLNMGIRMSRSGSGNYTMNLQSFKCHSVSWFVRSKTLVFAVVVIVELLNGLKFFS